VPTVSVRPWSSKSFSIQHKNTTHYKHPGNGNNTKTTVLPRQHNHNWLATVVPTFTGDDQLKTKWLWKFSHVPLESSDFIQWNGALWDLAASSLVLPTAVVVQARQPQHKPPTFPRMPMVPLFVHVALAPWCLFQCVVAVVVVVCDGDASLFVGGYVVQ
jgi:hypothetical protein